MNRLTDCIRLIVVLGLALALTGTTCAPPQVTTDNTGESSPAEDTKEQAVIIGSKSPEGISHFTVTGTNTDFGRYIALGEATFVNGQEGGVLLDGTGIAVLQAENGDQIVAEVTCRATEQGLYFTFHWRDSVTFSTGSTVSTTGAFVNLKPPGLALARIRGRMFDGGGPFISCYSCLLIQNCQETTCDVSCEICCVRDKQPSPPPCPF